jgi:hypothetical protein
MPPLRVDAAALAWLAIRAIHAPPPLPPLTPPPLTPPPLTPPLPARVMGTSHGRTPPCSSRRGRVPREALQDRTAPAVAAVDPALGLRAAYLVWFHGSQSARTRPTFSALFSLRALHCVCCRCGCVLVYDGVRGWLSIPRPLGCSLIVCWLLAGTLFTQRPMDRDPAGRPRAWHPLRRLQPMGVAHGRALCARRHRRLNGSQVSASTACTTPSHHRTIAPSHHRTITRRTTHRRQTPPRRHPHVHRSSCRCAPRSCRYADNILKTFAVGCSIVLNCAISSLFLHVPLTLPVRTRASREHDARVTHDAASRSDATLCSDAASCSDAATLPPPMHRRTD